MRAPEGLSRYLTDDKSKDRDKSGKFSKGSGLARYLKNSDTARSAGHEDTDEK
ncbi:hypothetical protein [Corynebacterium comes]|uniref:Uncharacterized protein n=1 Tax=Corynebacterium comes TaxID=2675218 RepID=A0A6B8VZI9_9CORY|nr:hypothetical protein [Corynebacterium comes]QGU05127.1 hypothetical protein CETAM_09380 [Corynebacterium comes]